MLTAMLAAQCLMAQIPAGIKFLNYEKNKSAKEAFQKAYDANPKDPQAIYWLGQAMLATDGASEPSKEQIAEVKALYQKGLQEVGSDAWLLVGMGHVGILEKEDINSVKQKFEQAITSTIETKGKNKGKPNPAILNAIGRANAEVGSDQGDHNYAIEKLKQAAAIDLTDPDILINMGINYLKMGGENGGDAVKAYQEALTRDPKNARAFYRIGKIYQSQNNKELATARLAVENARLEISKNRAGHYPRIDLIAAYSKGDAESINTYNQDTTNRTIGVQVNIPIYQGGAISATTRQAAAGYGRAQSDLDARTNKVMVELRKAHSIVLSSVHKIEALEKAVESGKLLMKATEQSIKGGVRINLDLLNAQQQLYTSQRDLAQARYSYLIGLLRLRAAAGTLDAGSVREIAAYFH